MRGHSEVSGSQPRAQPPRESRIQHPGWCFPSGSHALGSPGPWFFSRDRERTNLHILKASALGHLKKTKKARNGGLRTSEIHPPAFLETRHLGSSRHPRAVLPLQAPGRVLPGSSSCKGSRRPWGGGHVPPISPSSADMTHPRCKLDPFHLPLCPNSRIL